MPIAPPALSPPGKRYERRAFDPNAPGLEGLEWDSAELFTVGQTEAEGRGEGKGGRSCGRGGHDLACWWFIVCVF